MKRLLLLVVVLLLGFYVAWPGWSAYQIDGAIKARDAATLERKIDFSSVRVSLRPAFTQKVSELYDRQLQQTGKTGALIGGQLKQDVVPGMVEVLLVALVTPENLIRVAHEGGQIKDSVDRLFGEEMGRVGVLPGPGTAGTGQTGGSGFQLPGGLGDLAGKMGIDTDKMLGGKTAEPAPKTAQAPAAAPSFGFDNIKRFSILDPLGFEIGVAKDKAASEPDVTAEMRFTGTDWRVTAVRPRL
jgi:hypothetical protein